MILSLKLIKGTQMPIYTFTKQRATLEFSSISISVQYTLLLRSVFSLPAGVCAGCGF